MVYNPPLTIDVVNSAGILTGPGPLYNVLTASITTALDQIGELSVTIPATDPRGIDLVANEAHLRLYYNNEFIYEGIVNTLQKAATSDTPAYVLSGPGLLGELLYLSTQYERVYDNVATTDIIGTTASGTGLLRATGWTQGDVSPSSTPQTVKFNGQTIFAALATLAKQTGDHIRAGSSARTLDYGTFGDFSGVQVRNVPAVNYEMSARADLAYCAQLITDTLSADIRNRLYPQGRSGFDLRFAPDSITDIYVIADRGPLGATTTVAVAGATAKVVNVASSTGFAANQTIWIGDADDWTAAHEVGVIESVAAGVLNLFSDLASSYASGVDVIQAPQFYVEDSTSQATYGVREDTPGFNWIGPPDGVDDYAIVQQAAQVLYTAAKVHLTRYANPYTNYQLPVVFNFPQGVMVGDKIRLTYDGIVNVNGVTEIWQAIDALFFVLSITRTYAQDGSVTTALAISDVSRPAPNNVDLVVFNLDTNTWIAPNR